MADFNKPTVISPKTSFPQEIRDAMDTLSKWFDGTSDSNIPTGAKRWNDSLSRFEEFDGASWVELDSEYDINVTQLQGNSASDFASSSHVGQNGTAVHGLGDVSTLNSTNTVGNPGSNSLIPTENAVRTAVNAAGKITNAGGFGSSTLGNSVTTGVNLINIASTNSSGMLSISYSAGTMGGHIQLYRKIPASTQWEGSQWIIDPRSIVTQTATSFAIYLNDTFVITAGFALQLKIKRIDDNSIECTMDRTGLTNGFETGSLVLGIAAATIE